MGTPHAPNVKRKLVRVSFQPMLPSFIASLPSSGVELVAATVPQGRWFCQELAGWKPPLASRSSENGGRDGSSDGRLLNEHPDAGPDYLAARRVLAWPHRRLDPRPRPPLAASAA